MKAFIKKAAILAIVSVGIASTSAQAATWTNAAGTPLAIGTPVTVAGPLDISLFGFIGRKTCNVSVDGTVTAADTITFTASTPGFVSNCDSDNEGAVVFPFVVKALTGPDRAQAPSVSFNTPVGFCSGSLTFNWVDATTSEGTLPTNTTVSPCTMHAGSKLKVVGTLAGNVSIN